MIDHEISKKFDTHAYLCTIFFLVHSYPVDFGHIMFVRKKKYDVALLIKLTLFAHQFAINISTISCIGIGQWHLQMTIRNIQLNHPIFSSSLKSHQIEIDLDAEKRENNVLKSSTFKAALVHSAVGWSLFSLYYYCCLSRCRFESRLYGLRIPWIKQINAERKKNKTIAWIILWPFFM